MHASSPASPALPPLRASWRGWARFGAFSDPRVPGWMGLVWTAAFSAVIAAGFTLLGFVQSARDLGDWLDPLLWARMYGRMLVVSLVIGYAIHGLFFLARLLVGAERVARLGGWQRSLFFSAIVLLGVAIGWPAGMTLIYGGTRTLTHLSGNELTGVAAMSLLVCAILCVFFALRHRQLQAEARASEAQLRLLQGQMEPHFLFNTLATVTSLIEVDAPRARRVLEAFTDYLRASLGSLRRTESTLGAELELAESFLALMRERMGERLRYRIEADAAVRDAALPPLLLQPLIENAVRHGLEPQVDGGTVTVLAHLEHGAPARLRLSVEDDGAGLEAAARRQRRPGPRAHAGAGIALANLRERLAALHGGAASLTLAPRAGGAGVVAVIVMPYERARPGPPTAGAHACAPSTAGAFKHDGGRA
jgi:signal transduction histidine kinase